MNAKPPGDGLPVLGELLDGRYHIEAKIGAGGMGTVYRGVRAQLGKQVAIKTLELEIKESEREELVSRFAREAQATAAIRHENVVEIIDFGQTRACVYFVMELLEGYVLADVIGRGRSVAPARLVALALQAARGLHAAHELGIIHRDVKPSNIFIRPTRTGEERVKVLDFGLAKVSDGLKLTRAGMIFGSPSYMSPEQARGDELDARTDVYSLGCVLFEGLAGRPPFLGESFMEIVGQHLQQPPPRITELRPELELPAELEELIYVALAKEPEQRFAGMDALGRALASLELPSPPPVELDATTTVRAVKLAAKARPKLAERYPLLAQLALLYIAQSYSTDEELAPSELDRIARELHAWKPRATLRQLAGLVAFVREQYEGLGSREARRQRTREVVASLRAELSEEQRRHAIANMWKIAGADGEIIDAERRFITMTVERFNADEPEDLTQRMLPVFAEDGRPRGELEDHTERITPVVDAPEDTERITTITAELPAASETSEAEDELYEPTQFVRPVFSEPTGPLPLEVGPPPLEPPPLTSEPAPLLEQTPPPIEAFELSTSEATSELRELFEQAVAALEEMLAREQPLAALREGALLRWRDAMANLRAREGAAEQLRVWLEDGERASSERLTAALAWLKIGGARAREALLELAARSDELPLVEAVIGAIELGGGSTRDALLREACERAETEAVFCAWLCALERQGVDPGAALIARALASEQVETRAAGLRSLCVHAEREAHRYALLPELFARDPAQRCAALLAGLVLELPQARLLCAQVARLPGMDAPTYLHALSATDAQLDALLELAEHAHAPPAVEFALAACGRSRVLKVLVARAEQLSDSALLGLRLATGFSGSAQELPAWWAVKAEDFAQDVRYLLGQPWSEPRLLDALAQVDAQLWPWLRLELLVRSKSEHRLPLRALPNTLLEAIAAIPTD